MKSRTTMAAGVAAATLIVAIATPAQAARPQPSPEEPVTVYASVTPMYVVGFDPEVAIANGYEVVYDEAGNASLAEDSPSDSEGLITTNSVAVGTCGTSYVHLQDTGTKKFTVSTGWTTVRAASSYNWFADMGSSRRTWSGLLLLRSQWDAQWTGTVSSGGLYHVFAGGSVALVDGKICSSTVPTDYEYIY